MSQDDFAKDGQKDEEVIVVSEGIVIEGVDISSRCFPLNANIALCCNKSRDNR